MSHESQYQHVNPNALVPYYDEERNKWHIAKVVRVSFPNIELILKVKDGQPQQYEDSEHALDEIDNMNPENVDGDSFWELLRVVLTNHLKSDSELEE